MTGCEKKLFVEQSRIFREENPVRLAGKPMWRRREVKKGYHKLATAFLDSGHGRIFWPAKAQSGADAQLKGALCYPTDQERWDFSFKQKPVQGVWLELANGHRSIVKLLMQLFWKQNLTAGKREAKARSSLIGSTSRAVNDDRDGHANGSGAGSVHISHYQLEVTE